MKAILIALVAIAVASANGSELSLDKSKGEVTFLATGRPGALKIRGITRPEGMPQPLKGKLSLTENGLLGTATYDLNALDTGIELRNRHMKEKYLQTEKFPNAQFTITKLDLPKEMLAGNAKSKEVPLEGKLVLHGIEKAVKGTADVERDGEMLNLVTNFKIELSDFNIEIPSFMTVTVAKEVDVAVKVAGELTAPASR